MSSCIQIGSISWRHCFCYMGSCTPYASEQKPNPSCMFVNMCVPFCLYNTLQFIFTFISGLGHTPDNINYFFITSCRRVIAAGKRVTHIMLRTRTFNLCSCGREQCSFAGVLVLYFCG